MSFTTIDIQRFVSNAIEKASIDNKMEIKFDLDLFMKNINNVQDERRDDVVEVVVKKDDVVEVVVKDNVSEDKKKLTKEERLANKEAKEAAKKAKEAEKQAKEQAKSDKLAAKEAEKQAKSDKLAAKEAEKQAKEQAKTDKLAAKEAEKQAKEQAKTDKLAAKEQSKADKKKEKEDSKPKAKRGRPKKDNIVVASGDYIENVEAQSVDLIENLAQNVESESNNSSLSVNDDNEKLEDVQVHLFEYNGVMYYKSDDHVLYHHESQAELGNWDPIENEIVLK